MLLEMSKGSTHLVADFIVKGFLSRTLLHPNLTNKVLWLFPFLHSSFGQSFHLFGFHFFNLVGSFMLILSMLGGESLATVLFGTLIVLPVKVFPFHMVPEPGGIRAFFVTKFALKHIRGNAL